MNLINRVDKIWSEIEKGILGITTIIMSILLVGNALSRYLLNKSWGFTEEIGQHALIILTFMGIGYATRAGTHIEMSGFYDLLNKKYKRIVKLVVSIITAFIMLVCAYIGLKYVIHLREIEQVTPILRMPFYLIMTVVPLGFFIAFIRYVTEFFQTIVNWGYNK